jgi:AraC-like DNA-binding protein
LAAPHRLKHYEILYIQRGSGRLTVDLRRYDFTDNVIFYLSPGQYRLFELRGDVEGYQISLTHDFLHLNDLTVNYSAGEWAMRANPELDDVVKRVYKEYMKQDYLSHEILKSLLKILLIYLKRAGRCNVDSCGESATDNGIVQKFFALLQGHFVTKKLVADYADWLCITPNYLNAVVKKQTGFPASHHIQQYIILEAKRHALYSRVRMKEVADRLGFEDTAHFSKFFKNYSGMNFSAFKRNFT